MTNTCLQKQRDFCQGLSTKSVLISINECWRMFHNDHSAGIALVEFLKLSAMLLIQCHGRAPYYQQVWLHTRVEYVIIYKAFSFKLCYDKSFHIFFRLSRLWPTHTREFYLNVGFIQNQKESVAMRAKHIICQTHIKSNHIYLKKQCN